MHLRAILLIVGCLFQFRVPLLAQAPPGTILWVYNVGSAVSPAVGLEGTVYLGGTGLYAVTNAGTTASNKWTFPVAVASSPAIGSDGTVYFGAYDGLYALNPDGTKKWFYGLPSAAGAAAFGFDGTIYFQAAEDLYALTPAGTLKWKSAMTFPGTYSAPTVGLDGTIYVASSYEANLYAFDSDGTRKWVRALGSPCGDSPAVGRDGTIYVTGGDLYAFTPDGTNLWHTGGFFRNSPVIGKDGTLYIASSDYPYPLYRVTPAGQASPTEATEGIRYASPKCAAIDAGGTIWYCASNMVWALKPDGQILPLSHVVDDGYWAPVTSPVIGPDGVLYSVRGGRLYAIATGTNGPADSPWPMYRQNARHTGKIEKPALKPPQKRSDANFDLQVYAQVGLEYSVESSTNMGLDPWTPLTNFLATDVPMDVMDLTASNSPVKFYRAVQK